MLFLIDSRILFVLAIVISGPTFPVFTAAASGPFTAAGTWQGGIPPSGQCIVVIPTGFTVTLIGGSLDIEIFQIIVGGTFVITSTDSTSFFFRFIINMLIENGGTLQVDVPELLLPGGSLLTFLEDGSFIGASTTVQSYDIDIGIDAIQDSSIFGSSLFGPLTFAILYDGDILDFDTIMCVSGRSGLFTDPATWIGLVTPVDLCNSDVECSLFIPPGLSLLTESLLGEWRVPFSVITVSLGATIELGTIGAGFGFRFFFGFIFDIFGDLRYASSFGEGLFFSLGTFFNCYPGSSLGSPVSIPLLGFNPETGVVIPDQVSLGSSSTTPIFVWITLDGTIIVSDRRKYCLFEDMLSVPLLYY